MSAMIGSCTVSQVEANTWNTVAHGSVSSPPQDAEERRALLRRRAPVDDVHALALALVNGPRPAKNPGAASPSSRVVP